MFVFIEMQLASLLDSTVVLRAIVFSSTNFALHRATNVMRTGSTVIVQCPDFVIAGGCGPLENLVRCGFANELLAGKPENFTHVGIGFGA